MHLRKEEPRDHDAVDAVVRAAFRDHPEQVAGLLSPMRRLLERWPGASLVAEDDGEIVGHVVCTRSILDAPRRLVDVQVLSPLAVRPDHQRRGVGSALVHGVVDAVGRLGAPAVFLEGSPDYYSRLGFVPGGTLGFRKPSLRIPDAAFQVRLLDAYEPWMTGTLVYDRLFWDADAVGLRDPDAGAVGGA